MRYLLERLLRDLSLRTRILDRTVFSAYPYQHKPYQLQYLLECITQTKDVSGAIIEIGCAHGATTIFLKKYLDDLGCSKRYIAVDTFSGFTTDDVDHEIRVRGKTPLLSTAFRQNKVDWVEHSLELADVHGVELRQADCAAYDYTEVGPTAFCFIDVDLYKPVLASLEAIHPKLTRGAIVVVDDCQPHPMWDGALQAYTEYVGKNGLPLEIDCEKFGIIRKAG